MNCTLIITKEDPLYKRTSTSPKPKIAELFKHTKDGLNFEA